MSLPAHARVVMVAVLLAINSVPRVAHSQQVQWDVQMVYGGLFQESMLNVARHVDRLTSSQFKLKVYAPGDLVNHTECFNAVANGTIDACWTNAAITSNQIPAAVFFGSVPFGLDTTAGVLAWLASEPANTLRDELYTPHGVTSLLTLCKAAETSGWFVKPIDTVEDFKGLKMRFFGIGAKVTSKLGVQSQNVGWFDIVPSLTAGKLDGVEGGGPKIDLETGFHKVAKYLYTPAWHQGTACTELVINKKKFDALPARFRETLTITTKSVLADFLSSMGRDEALALGELADKHGVEIRRWSDDQLAALEEAWLDVVAEESAKDAAFKRVADAYFEWERIFRQRADRIQTRRTYLK